MAAKRKGKWIDGLAANDTAETAAHTIMHVRLQALDTAINDAVTASFDPPTTKQLRVLSRRAESALIVLRPHFKDSRYMMMRKQLRTLRRAVSHLRNNDVHASLISQYATTDDAAHQQLWQMLLRETHAARDAACEELASVIDHLAGKRFQKRTNRLLDAVKPVKGIRTLHELAQQQLPNVIAPLLRAAEQDWTQLENLHALRRKSKRLRYAMEVFACCFAPDVHRDLYQQLESVQDQLGPLNDRDELCARLRQHASQDVVADDVADSPDHAGERLQQFDQLEAQFVAQLQQDAQAVRQWLYSIDLKRLMGAIILHVQVPWHASEQNESHAHEDVPS